jgi:hypothetical protein
MKYLPKSDDKLPDGGLDMLYSAAGGQLLDGIIEHRQSIIGRVII